MVYFVCLSHRWVLSDQRATRIGGLARGLGSSCQLTGLTRKDAADQSIVKIVWWMDVRRLSAEAIIYRQVSSTRLLIFDLLYEIDTHARRHMALKY
jgi:hypothetical protein